MDVRLRKEPCVCCYFRVLSKNYYLACIAYRFTKYALCGIFSAISVLLTTENSDDLEIQVPGGQGH